jgi:hypothetical protein
MFALLCFVLAVLALPFKSKSRLEAENVALRHQLIVLRRKVQGRVRLTNNDRWLFNPRPKCGLGTGGTPRPSYLRGASSFSGEGYLAAPLARNLNKAWLGTYGNGAGKGYAVTHGEPIGHVTRQRSIPETKSPAGGVWSYGGARRAIVRRADRNLMWCSGQKASCRTR